MIEVTSSIVLDDGDLEERFIRSPGPGGQKVNKTETGVQLRFDARNSAALSHAVFRRLKTLAGRRMTAEGVIVISATQYRTQERNRRDAVERLVDLIREAAIPPKHRRPTRPTKASVKRRLEGKRRRSDVKKGRGGGARLDD